MTLLAQKCSDVASLVGDGAAGAIASPGAVAVGPASDTGVTGPRRAGVVMVVVVMAVVTPGGDDLLVIVVLGPGLSAEAHFG